MEQLRQEKLEIDQQLRSIHGSGLGSMQSLSMGRRNDHRGGGGYNNTDADGGGRSGRGSMRGRGGGGGGGGRGRGGGAGRQNDHHPQHRYNTGTNNTTNDLVVNNVDKRNIDESAAATLQNNNNNRGRGGSGINDRPPWARGRPNKGRLSRRVGELVGSGVENRN